MFQPKKHVPSEVFTPRAHAPSPSMYVNRPELERALLNALQGNKHIIVHGESGSGKSWLYKKVLEEQNARYLIADLANASRFKSITTEFDNLVGREQKPRKVGYEETKEADGSLGFLSAGISHVGKFELTSKEPFEKCLELLRGLAGKGLAVLIWDNFERIVNNADLVQEASDLIALADNPDYAAYHVRILIVGVPADLRAYIADSDHSNTISNRLTEIPEVARLSQEEAYDLIRRGFVQQLGYKMSDEVLKSLSIHVCWITDRIPQHIHEYCLELANICDSNHRTYEDRFLNLADRAWLNSALVQSMEVVEQNMNARNTAAGRRNQAIYAIGACGMHDFTYYEIEQTVRQHFPESTRDLSLNISAILQQLASGEFPLVKQTPKGNAYRLVNPKLRMCIRTMLQKTTQETVVKRVTG